MKVESFTWSPDQSLSCATTTTDADLVLFFGSRAVLGSPNCYAAIKSSFPSSQIVGCTTGGQIHGDEIEDDAVTGVAVSFDRTRIYIACETIETQDQSLTCGESLGAKLAAPDLKAIFVLSDGLRVNGSSLVKGLSSKVSPNTSISGGLAGDGAAFHETLVSANCPPKTGIVAAIGFYGDALQIGYACASGWDVFGPKRRVTRSEGNVLYELDGAPALDLYEKYLGPTEAQLLPSSALLYPLQFVDPENQTQDFVRTVLSVDRAQRSMTFAGDIPNGAVAQLMRGQIDRLASSCNKVAAAKPNADGNAPELALLVSCIGRRLVMGQRTLDEIESTLEGLGSPSHVTGFYSYGEIAPHPSTGRCALHNQTMTVTTFSELV